MLNLPNILTLVRILVIPIFVLVFYLPVPWGHTCAAVIFGLACATDWLDGYLARSLQQATRFGAFLDPVADKLMVSIALIMIVAEAQFKFVSGKTVMYAVPTFLITIPSAIIVSREIIVSALREWMAEIGKQKGVVVSYMAKVKTTLQMLALIVLIYCTPTTSASVIAVGYVLLYAAAILTIWSMVVYLKTAWPEFQIN
jgi:CDP-diacylglycerol---glycerol-3-phosphate 3-phosphatidyltransferase